jgi:streptogramin lyase
MKNSRFIFLPAVAGVVSILGLGSAMATEDVFVTNNGNNTVEEIAPGGVDTTFASTGLNGPTGLVFNTSGDLFVANNGSGDIEEFSSNGTLLNGAFATGLNAPRGLVIDTQGNLYVANQSIGTIDKISPSGVVTTFATGFYAPTGLAIDANGNILVTNEIPNASSVYTISEISPGGVVSTFASNPVANLNAPDGIGIDPNTGLVYVVNKNVPSVEQIVPGSGGALNLVYSIAGLDNPEGLTVDNSGNVFVTNLNNNTITEYSPGPQSTVIESVFATGLDYPCFVTTVNLNVVPEPSTYALLLAGLGLLFFAYRRKTAKA